MYLDGHIFWASNSKEQVLDFHLQAIVQLSHTTSRRSLYTKIHDKEVYFPQDRRQLLNAASEDVGYTFGVEFYVVPFRCNHPFFLVCYSIGK
eukprot:UN03336